MRKMSIEERKEWHKNHLADHYLNLWRSEIENQVILAKDGCIHKNFTDALSMILTSNDIEDLTNMFYYGAPVIEQVLCKQEWLGCDLSDLHAEIKDNNYETGIYCLIKNNQIIKTYYIKGYTHMVPNTLDFDKIVSDAKKLNAEGIYHAHNHPCTLAAWPSSIGDTTIAKKQETEASKNGLLYNWGVVSCEDYWDYEQMNLNYDVIKKYCKERYNQEEKATNNTCGEVSMLVEDYFYKKALIFLPEEEVEKYNKLQEKRKLEPEQNIYPEKRMSTEDILIKIKEIEEEKHNSSSN